MRVCGFDLTVEDINKLTVPTISYWVRDDDDNSFHIPFTLALSMIDLRDLISCRCTQCLAIAILAYALGDVGSQFECPNSAETYKQVADHPAAHRRRGAHEATPK